MVKASRERPMPLFAFICGAVFALIGRTIILAMADPPAKVAGLMNAHLFAVVEHVNDANQGDD